MSRTDHVTVYNLGAKPAVLPLSWRLGALVDRAFSYGARTRTEIVQQLRRHIARHGVPVGLSFWCHGNRNGVVWGKEILDPEWLIGQIPELRGCQWVWLRCCSVFSVHELAMRWTNAFRCVVYGHCTVISGKRPIFGGRLRIGMPHVQGEVVGLLPGHRPRWPESGDGLPRAFVTQMRPNPAWIQPRLMFA